MSRHVEFVIALLVVVVVGVLGALSSRYIRNGGHWLAAYVPGLLCTGTWAWMARRSPYNIIVSSSAWTIAYDAAWLATAIFVMKEATTPMQAVGAVVVVVGLLLMGI